LYNLSIVEKEGEYYGADANFFGKRLHFFDSFKMIPKALKKFPETFKFEGIVKEVFPYDFYKENDVFSKVDRELVEAEKYVKECDKEQFRSNHKKVVEEYCSTRMTKMMYRNTFHKEGYAKFYCKQDVRILRDGYMEYRKLMRKIMGLDTLMFYSLSSISDTFMKKRGVYEGVYEIGGMLRKFIQSCNKGGRVMCRDNQKHIVDGIIDYFDAVSLYPSAMERLSKDGYGIPTGTPKVIRSVEEFESIMKEDRSTMYYIKIRILGVEKILHMPILSKVDHGVRNYIVPKDEIYFCDRIEFEDLLCFHKLQYEFIEGYVFRGCNMMIGEVIRHLFNSRVKAKKKDKDGPLQDCLKQSMNASYGKNGLKESKYKMKYFDKKQEYEIYRGNNAGNIVESSEKNGKYKIKMMVPVLSHKNRCHVSSVILSMSKRIMNEVICLAEDMSIKIYYQDTDSMFLKRDELSRLKEMFESIYGRRLVGSDMGQFHCDFELKGADDPRSDFSIFLGKKFHAHHVIGKDKDGHNLSRDHIRSKGFPTSCLTRYADRNEMMIPGRPDLSSLLGLYYKLYLGDKFVLNIADKDGPSIRSNGMANKSMWIVPRTAHFPQIPDEIINNEGKIVSKW
jgi:hypothetical protein